LLLRTIQGLALLQILFFRFFFQRSSFFIFIGFAVALIVISQVQPLSLEKIRTSITDIASPVLGFISRPASSVSNIADNIESIVAVRKENAKLREENSRLMLWQPLVSHLESENLALRKLLNVIPDPDSKFTTARIVGDAGGPFVRTLLVAAGENQGVYKGQAVITHGGLVGRIVEAGNSSARILLITDLNSRIPIVLEKGRNRGILVGLNTDTLEIQFLPLNAQPDIGDRLVTSGAGGVFPPGLPVGYISDISEESIQVEPWVTFDRLEFVSILDYILPGIMPSTRRAGLADMID